MRSSPSKDRAEKRSIVLPAVPWPASDWKQIVLIEDNSARAQRRPLAGVGSARVAADVVLRLHKITPNGILLVRERAYTTVRDAIADLPRIGNGHDKEATPYTEPTEQELRSKTYLGFVRAHAPKHLVSDHVTSRHADYVIERYKQIPAGGNWEDITDSLTNYADVERTHSNIYRRLACNQPSITIGHYRKSMLVHPRQNRGLSLREASRLQSFPDWFRFSGTVNGGPGGLMHKQQQLANAVCPLVTKAVAEFLLKL
jgi:site-specific DNA-cytosine methylase